MVLQGAGVSTRGVRGVPSKTFDDERPCGSYGGGDELRQTNIDKKPRCKRQLPRIINNPVRILMRNRSYKKKDGHLEKFTSLRESKATDLNTTGLSTTDSSNVSTACLEHSSLASSPISGNNVDDSSSSVHTEHESFTQLDVPEMLCRKESGLTQKGIESSDLVLTHTSSCKDPNAPSNASREMENIVRRNTHDDSQSTEFSDRMKEQEEDVAERKVHSNDEEATIEHSPAAWLPPLEIDYLMSLANADLLATDERPLTEIHVPLPPKKLPNTKRSKSFADKAFERKQRDKNFQKFLEAAVREKSRQEPLPQRVRMNMTGGLSSSEFPLDSDFSSTLTDEIEIKSDLTTVPSSGGMRLRKVQSMWTPARTRRTQLAMKEKEMFLSKKGLKSWDKPSFDDVKMKPCLVQTRNLNEKYEEDIEKDSLMNFPINGENLFGSTKTVASTVYSSSIYATSDDLDTNSVPEIGASCGLFCGPCIEMNKQPVQNCDESVHSEDFSILLQKQIGAKRSSTELMNEIRSEVLETVQKLAREGSTVVREFVEKRGNRN